MTLDPQDHRHPDRLDELLPSGITVREAIERQWGRVVPDERRTKRGIPKDA